MSFSSLAPRDLCLSPRVKGLLTNTANKMAKGVSLINHNKVSEPANARQSRFLAHVAECNTHGDGCKGVLVSK